jgi:hypothetical protein
MRTSGILLIVIVLVFAISLVCVWFYPSVQDFMASNIMWNGIRKFSSEFAADHIESLDDLPSHLDGGILVVIPYLEYTDDELARMKQFVNDGGTLLLMDDYGHGNHVLEYLGIPARFTNKPLLDPLFCYRNQTMPRITDFAPEVKESDIDVIMLNHASTLINVPESEAIAWSSAASFLDLNENGVKDPGEPEGPLVVAAEFRLEKGRLVLLSDPSVAINTMVGRDDNYVFIDYLLNHEGEQKEIRIDNSHLTRAPLDISKTRLLDTREVLASPYALLGINALIFVAVSGYLLRREKTIE